MNRYLPYSSSRSSIHRWKKKMLKRRSLNYDISYENSSNEPMPLLDNSSNEVECDYEFQCESNQLELSVVSNPLESFVNQDINQIIMNKLIKLHQLQNVTNSTFDEFLSLIDLILSNKNETLNIPKSFYQYKKMIETPLKRYYGFQCPFCNTKSPTQEKTNKKFSCSNCNRSFKYSELSKKEQHFHFDLKQVIELLLDKYEILEPVFSDDNTIKTFFDSLIFKDIFNSIATENGLIILSVFVDGAAVNRSPKIWPIIVRINNLNCSEELRTFLSSCLSTMQKNPGNNY